MNEYLSLFLKGAVAGAGGVVGAAATVCVFLLIAVCIGAIANDRGQTQ